MIDELDDSLELLLMRELPSPLHGKVNISFATPDDQFSPGDEGKLAVNLFLYDVRENNELRSNEWEVRRKENVVCREPPSIRIDCSYLVTAWSSADERYRPKEEHRVLSEVMKILLRYPTIPEEVLKGSLKDQAPPLPATALQPGRLQSLGEFWQALGGKPKAAFDYTVTISVQPHTATETGIVKYITLDMRYKEGRADKGGRELEKKEIEFTRRREPRKP